MSTPEEQDVQAERAIWRDICEEFQGPGDAENERWDRLFYRAEGRIKRSMRLRDSRPSA